MLGEISQSQKDKYCMSPLIWGPCQNYRPRVEWWLTGAREEENRELLFKGYSSSVLQDEKSSRDGWQW